jgi:hypothetical protein
MIANEILLDFMISTPDTSNKYHLNCKFVDHENPGGFHDDRFIATVFYVRLSIIIASNLFCRAQLND